MSTWRLISADGGDYQWELSERSPATHLGNDVHGDPARLPSKSDLLLQGRPELVENNGSSATGYSPMFRTGLGKPVAVKQSSIAKAQRVLRDDDLPRNGPMNKKGRRPGSNSLFQTGSGKMVSVSSASLVRAKTLLGLEEDHDSGASQVFGQSRKPFSNDNGYRSANFSSWEKDGRNIADVMVEESVSGSRMACQNGSGKHRLKHVASNSVQPKMHEFSAKPAPIKFQTAGGRSISISSDALKRARNLLGEPELGSFLDEVSLCDYPSNKENETPRSLQYQVTPNHTDVMSFASPILNYVSNGGRLLDSSMKIKGGSNLIAQFDAAASDSPDRIGSDLDSLRRSSMGCSFAPSNPTVTKDCDSGKNCDVSPTSQVLLNISNRNDTNYSNNVTNISETRFGSKSSVSPFKRPRSSKFSTPLKRNNSLAPSGLSKSSVQPPSTVRVSARYPFVLPRASMKEYFGGPPLDMGSTYNIEGISSDEAVNFMFSDDSGLNCIGVEAFFHMLIQSGASEQRVSKLWVANHYRWIVWKLACYERCYPAKTVRKFLTISNVLEELKYRYEREVNHGHRSAIKRILEGGASPSSMLVLCVAAICSNCDLKNEGSSVTSEGNNSKMKLELTDGWYSMDAVLDALLSNHCHSGKVFVGQKLRIWGARLCGWDAPVSPLEATKRVSLLLHVNGTYRAHWADRLGFCKGHCPPLAFRCIKSNGGPVPQTLVGVTRIYPILFKESLSGGGSVVRSERMELEVNQMHYERRSAIIDGVISEFQRAKDFHIYNDSDSEEGAKISKILETAEEPELLMAEMNPEQLNAFAAYRSKMEVTRQLNIEKYIEKALRDAGLSEREVTPFMRVRVVGLRRKACRRKGDHEKGLITIWNPTERQQHELVEGQAYVFSGLIPINSASDHIYLQGRGSTIKWKPLTSQESENFRPFFSPREAVSLSRLGEVSLSSEFDIAGFVVYVGEVFTTAQQRKQWVFVTDGSTVESRVGELSCSLLAICFCWQYADEMSFILINSNLVGSTVGFCNLVKKEKDQMNHIWVADATENSTYFVTFDSPLCSHLKDAAISTQAWAKMSDLKISKLRERVLFIVGDSKG